MRGCVPSPAPMGRHVHSSSTRLAGKSVPELLVRGGAAWYSSPGHPQWFSSSIGVPRRCTCGCADDPSKTRFWSSERGGRDSPIGTPPSGEGHSGACAPRGSLLGYVLASRGNPFTSELCTSSPSSNQKGLVTTRVLSPSPPRLHDTALPSRRRGMPK
ncbi:hypothetical protein L227DRAFT_67332 [Lentinus tigrinus ALCF2SS1-6]|uniref:Uncharacterized protein n=1 Tax=Lentinus tigrinus ALCF2SS1-6 TaxID=1328759 RepID=A0A5C2SC39_9APHY|nr:hypothetical protein L227DRAFT_67332 [Lentinus tigrinus ALCF2SS1-6]